MSHIAVQAARETPSFNRMPTDRRIARAQEEILGALKALLASDSLYWGESGEPIQQVAQLLKLYQSDDEEGRAALRNALDIRIYHLLLTFAQHTATLAVRERSNDWLDLGLRAIALAGSASVSDSRDTGMRTQPIRDAAARLGPATIPLFDQAAKLATSRTARLILASRPWFGFWGTIGMLLHRRFAQEFWKPVGRGSSFRYGTGRGVSREEAIGKPKTTREGCASGDMTSRPIQKNEDSTGGATIVPSTKNYHNLERRR